MFVIVDDEETEFHPGKIVYHLIIQIPKQEDTYVTVTKDLLQGKFIIKEKLNPVAANRIIFELENYLAARYVQSDY